MHSGAVYLVAASIHNVRQVYCNTHDKCYPHALLCRGLFRLHDDVGSAGGCEPGFHPVQHGATQCIAHRMQELRVIRDCACAPAFPLHATRYVGLVQDEAAAGFASPLEQVEIAARLPTAIFRCLQAPPPHPKAVAGGRRNKYRATHAHRSTPLSFRTSTADCCCLVHNLSSVTA